jgi:hypothetical protein
MGLYDGRRIVVCIDCFQVLPISFMSDMFGGDLSIPPSSRTVEKFVYQMYLCNFDASTDEQLSSLLEQRLKFQDEKHNGHTLKHHKSQISTKVRH